MTAQILDGKALAATIKAELKERVTALAEQGITPGLGTVLVGDDPGSHSYVAGKHRDCKQVGIASLEVQLPASTSAEELQAEIERLNADPACTRPTWVGWCSPNPVRCPAPRAASSSCCAGTASS